MCKSKTLRITICLCDQSLQISKNPAPKKSLSSVLLYIHWMYQLNRHWLIALFHEIYLMLDSIFYVTCKTSGWSHFCFEAAFNHLYLSINCSVLLASCICSVWYVCTIITDLVYAPRRWRERKVAEDSMENQTSQAFITTKTMLFLHHFCVGVFVVQLSEFHLVFKSYLLHYSVCLLPTTFFSIESISICIKPPKHSCRLA